MIAKNRKSMICGGEVRLFLYKMIKEQGKKNIGEKYCTPQMTSSINLIFTEFRGYL